MFARSSCSTQPSRMKPAGHPVGQHDEIPARVLAGLERRLDRPEELVVVVDDLGVLHGRAVLRLEVLEGLVLRLVVVVRVDVQGPVGEVQLGRRRLGHGRRRMPTGRSIAGCGRTAAVEGAALPVPLVPHAARKALNPAMVEPCRNRRRLRSGTGAGLSLVHGLLQVPGRGATGHVGTGSGDDRVGPDHEAVIRRPRQANRFPRFMKRAVDGPFHVLLVDGQARPRARFDHVGSRHAEVRRIDDRPFDLVGTGRRLGTLLVHPDLLRPDADLDVPLAVHQRLRDPDPGIVSERGDRVAVGRSRPASPAEGC